MFQKAGQKQIMQLTAHDWGFIPRWWRVEPVRLYVTEKHHKNVCNNSEKGGVKKLYR